MRLTIGSKAPDFTAQALGGRKVDLAALRGRTVLLKFYRFATCPVCNLHMHRFISQYPALQALGLTTVVLYHSPASKLEEANEHGLAAFRFGSRPGKAHLPRVWGGEGAGGDVLARGHARILSGDEGWLPSGDVHQRGGITGNPADFIIDAEGRIAFAHYGRHYADSLDVGQILETTRKQAAMPPSFAAQAL